MISIRQSLQLLSLQHQEETITALMNAIRAELQESLAKMESENAAPITITLQIKQTVTQRPVIQSLKGK